MKALKQHVTSAMNQTETARVQLIPQRRSDKQPCRRDEVDVCFCVSVCFYVSPGKVRRMESFFFPPSSIQWNQAESRLSPRWGIHKLQQMKTKCFQLPLAAGWEWLCSPAHIETGDIWQGPQPVMQLSVLCELQRRHFSCSVIYHQQQHALAYRSDPVTYSTLSPDKHKPVVRFSRLVVWFVKCQQTVKMFSSVKWIKCVLFDFTIIHQ